eukprot:CAMPEP_0198441360 /NCGR_PEP_ID=MMETSP1452-20131203/62368_1 /TAXON_ID=1181717 /ORGANISM="Synchroma pusillum, Strain CCMP3072" /LENGTH=432 /DNA_ID=CAMNT_0044161985 /DNA_START=71 /DNA_END=1367 /DNA_ORIENTATION=+
MANFRIREGIVRTNTVRSAFLTELTGAESIFLKKDHLQYTGSFKERGARNSLMLLSPEEKARGVIAASAGNHAQALAWHGNLLNIPVTCIMPTVAPITKVSKCRKFGANVVIHGAHIGEARQHALDDPAFEGMRYINGYDDPEIIAGAGTLGIELFEQVKDLDMVVVPVGGAGLIAGVSLALKTLKPEITIVGVEPAHCPSFQHAVEVGEPSYIFKGSTLADGLAVPVVGSNAFKVARRHVDYTVSVSERQIALAVLRLVELEKMVVEGGGAAGLAAVLPGGPLADVVKDKRVAIPLCGGNIDITVLGRVIDRGLAADGRLVRFVATVSDRPGGIAALTREIADLGVSIKDIYHERAWLHTSVDQVQVKCVVETTGIEHSERLRNFLVSKYPVQSFTAECGTELKPSDEAATAAAAPSQGCAWRAGTPITSP